VVTSKRTKETAIEEMCRLRQFVMREVFAYEHPAVCFCGKRERDQGYTSQYWFDSPEVFRFIRAAVVEKAAEVRRGRAAKRRTTMVRPLP
jgi:hypothetical protein